MNSFLKLQQNRDILYGRERNCLKTPEQLTCVVYLHVILVRMHERDAAAEKEYNTVLQITLEQILAQRFKENTKCKAKVTDINKYKTRKFFVKNVLA